MFTWNVSLILDLRDLHDFSYLLLEILKSSVLSPFLLPSAIPYAGVVYKLSPLSLDTYFQKKVCILKIIQEIA